MEQIIDRLYVGNDSDYEKLKGRSGWSVLRCCKEGPGGHRETVDYGTRSAPQGKEYLAALRGPLMALNFIDSHDPNFIPLEMVSKGIEFIGKRLAEGDKVLVACNLGHSRGPTTAMLYLRSVGELTGSFGASERIFKTLYPHFDPGIGVRQFARSHWHSFGKGEHGR